MIEIIFRVAGDISKLIARSLATAVVLSVVVMSIGPALAQEMTDSEATVRLFEAIEENNLQGVKINTIGGADLAATNGQDMTPIDLAIDRGYFDIVYYLLAYRDSRKTIFSSQAAKPKQAETPAPVEPVPARPVPVASLRQPVSAVAGIYTPPPGSDPWSATVVTSAPPPPEPAFQGPSPFDPGSRPPGSDLTIIGDIRGPAGPEPEAATPEAPREDIEEAVVIEPDTIAGEVDAPVQPAPAEKIAIIADVRPAPAMDPSPIILPLRKPLPPARKIVEVPETPIPTLPARAIEPNPVAAEPSPLFDDPEITPISKPEPVVLASREVAPPAIVEPVSATLIDRQPKKIIQVKAKPPPQRRLIPVQTTLPGKPVDDRGFFDKIISALSFGDDEPAPKQIAHNRVIMDLPPRLPSAQGASNDNGWAVRKIEKATPASYPGIATLQATGPTGEPIISPLKNLSLSLVNDLGLGLSPPKANSAEFDKSCIEKKSGSLAFCIVELKWPNDIAGLFATSTVLYEGTKAIVRYDEGSATYYHTLFPSESFGGIVDYFTARYGPPTKSVERSIAPLASPRISNPTVIWHSVAPVTKLLTTLEIRTFDDTSGGFPDTRRGVALLYHQWSRPVFPHVSTVELMMLSANQQR